MAIAAVAMMDNRKRPLAAAADMPGGINSDIPAKRIQLDPSSIPTERRPSPRNGRAVSQDEGEEEEDNPAYKGLEEYRKEAIYRQMRDSRRELQRAERKIRTLQQSLEDVRERTGAFNHFWDLLVEDVRILFQTDASIEAERSALFDVIPFTAGQPSKGAFSASMQERAQGIRALLSRLASIAPQSTNPEVAELQGRCHQLAEEASLLRQKSVGTQDRLDVAKEDLDALTESLRKAEKKIDRLQSRTVLLSERPSTLAEEEAEEAKRKAAEAEKDAAERRREVAEADTNGMDSNSLSATRTSDSSASRDELIYANELAEKRLQEATDLHKQVSELRSETERLQLDLHRIPEDRTRETPLYRDLHGHFTHAQQELERFKSVYEALEAENVDLREKRLEFQASAQKEASAISESLKEQLKTKDADVARLRSQRDDALGEVSERKQRESIKLAQGEELKQLVASKDLRIDTLRSEVRRLQMALAASTGDASRLETLRASNNADAFTDEDVTLLESLSKRLKMAEENSADLKRQLDAAASTTSEADLLAQVASLQAELSKIKNIVSDVQSADDVMTRLTEQTQRVSQLEGELAAANESTNALCEEVEKLSKAFTDMDRQASSKVMDLSRMEDKVLRLTTEKAKADNKYFSAMRSKDALENDRRQVLRTVERQVQVIERYTEAEAQFAQHLASHEREVTSLRRMIASYTARIAEIERDLKTSRMRESEASHYRTHAEERLQQAVVEAESEKAKRIRVEEQFAKMERDVEKAKKQVAAAAATAGAGGSATKSVAESEVDFLQALLRCSSCKDRYRDKIITKCMHTYCSPCIEARIQTRQRKCPHCGIPFAVSEVQPLYFQ